LASAWRPAPPASTCAAIVFRMRGSRSRPMTR
jgi:hypothetical protein